MVDALLAAHLGSIQTPMERMMTGSVLPSLQVTLLCRNPSSSGLFILLRASPPPRLRRD